MSIPRLVDVHTHVQFHAFAEDADEVIRRSIASGVWLINVGTQRVTSQAAVEIAHRHQEGVWATIGLHPIHTEKSYHDPQELGSEEKGFTSRGEEFDPSFYETLGRDSHVVGIGECGLDYYRLGEKTKERQAGVFLGQMELAKKLRKPLMIHCRNAFGDLVVLLKARRSLLGDPPGLVHFFSGSRDDASALLDLGFSFSFGGVITFARDYDEVVSYIPLERVLLETDAPYVTPIPYRGKRNEPMFVIEVSKKLAALKGVPEERIAEQTTANARVLFKI